ncbi:MAG: hypothetical protein RL518_1203 [Pseudomonadota bacterium]
MPIPKDHSLETLRAKLDRAVTRAEKAAPEGRSKALTSARKDRENLEKLVATTSQVSAYRDLFPVAWADQFVPVATFSRQDLFGYQGTKLVDYLWSSLPNSRFKRFQELFCEPENYSVPKPDLTGIDVQYPERDLLNACSLAGCLVSPARIPFRLLVDLGIVPEPKRELTELEALKIKSSESVIHTLKAMWESMEILPKGNHRFGIIRQLSPGSMKRYPKAKTLPETVLGSFVYTKENVSINRSSSKTKRGPWVAPELVCAFYPNVYASRRKADHQMGSYRLETVSIGNLALEWNELNERASTQWRASAPSEVKQSIREALLRLVTRSTQEFKRVNHTLKQQAKEKFEALEESLAKGSNNITAQVSAANAAVTRLEKRLSDMPRKSAYNMEDAEQLSQIINSGEHAFTLISESLYTAGIKLRDEINRRDGYFSQRHLSEPERAVRTKVLLTEMNIPHLALKCAPSVRPFRVFATAQRKAYEELEGAILTQDVEGAKRAMVALTVYSKFQRANAVFEKLRCLTSASAAVPLSELRSVALSLRALIEKRAVFPQTNVPALKDSYNSLQRSVTSLAKGLEYYHRKGIELDERMLRYKRLRIFLDQTDLEAETARLLAPKTPKG